VTAPTLPPLPTSPPSAEPADRGPLNLILLALAIAGLGLAFGASLIWVVLGFVTMIFLHELGHYLTARWGGMKVTEFFIGFGPRIWSFRRGEVEYGIKAIPAGAYVRIIGMSTLEEVDPADEDRTYRSKSYPRRLAVAIAGSTMHFIVAIILMFALFATYGIADATSWRVGDVSSDSAASAAGIVAGDHLLRVGDTPVGEFDQLKNIVGPLAGQTTTVTVERSGQTLTLPITIGERLSAEAAAQIPGTHALDIIRQVDGVAVATFADFTSRVQAGGTYDIEVRRDLSSCTVRSTITQVPVGAPTLGVLGIVGESESERLSVVSAATHTGTEFVHFTGAVVTGMGNFFTSGISSFVSDTVQNKGTVTNIDGTNKAGEPTPTCQRVDEDQASNNTRLLSILGAGQLVKSSIDKNGMQGFLSTMVSFNITIGLFNLIPLLPFDGGHVVVATYERLREIGRRGRRYHADVTKLLPVAYAVVAIFVTLGVLALVRDAVNPIG
jgi:RIP metalloprotease RseP